MSLLSLRADIGTESTSSDVVTRFFAALDRGRLEEASRLTTDGFEWFGKALSWRSPKLAAWAAAERIAVSAVRPLGATTVEEMPDYAVERCFGALKRGDKVMFADVTRAGTTTTAVVVIRGRRPKVVRVMDPEKFTSFVDYAAIMAKVSKQTAARS